MEAGVECRVFHGLSITTLAGAVGLSNYKFGRNDLHLPLRRLGGTSPLEVVAVNWAKTSTRWRCSTSTQRVRHRRSAPHDAF